MDKAKTSDEVDLIDNKPYREIIGNLVAERISNHYLVQELFWLLEFRIYIFRPMRMTDATLPGSPPRAA